MPSISNHPSSRARCVLLALPLLIAGCATTSAPALVPPPSYVSYFDKAPCTSRIGRCFDASIGGHPVVVIAEKARSEQLTRMARAANDQVRDIYWEVVGAVDGSKVFDISASPNALGRSEIGELKSELDLQIYPLDDQELASKSELAAQNGVRVNGQPVVTQQNTLTQDHLPPGRYVIAITYRGQKNWERKQVLVTVR